MHQLKFLCGMFELDHALDAYGRVTMEHEQKKAVRKVELRPLGPLSACKHSKFSVFSIDFPYS
jgi:hypothetical protein